MNVMRHLKGSYLRAVARFGFAIFAVLVSAVAASPANAAPTQYPYTLTDALNRKVTIKSAPKRIVSLSPAITETIWMLGAGSSQIGRSDFCDYPPEVSKLKSVGGIVNANIESVALMQPDVVLVHQGVPKEIVAKLSTLGITVVTFETPSMLWEILDQIEDIGVILDCSDKATDFVGEKNGLLVKMTDSLVNAGYGKPRVFIGGHSSPYITSGKGTFIDDLIKLAGGMNIATMSNFDGIMPARKYPELSAEQILLADPQAIVITADLSAEGARDAARAAVARDRAFKVTSAVRDGNILVIEEDMLLRPGPRIFDTLVQISDFIKGIGK